MQYQINDFVFDDQTLMLFKQGEAIIFRSNEAKLLALFLTNPTKVFSKEAILNEVWSGKVVAEQAVFQNISHLRALFGEDAIKTFSKKGYRWQLSFELKQQIIDTTSVNEITAVLPLIKKRAQKSWLGAAVLIAVMAFVSITYYEKNTHTHSNAEPSIAILPLLLEPVPLETMPLETMPLETTNENAVELQSSLLEPLWKSLLQNKNYHAVQDDNLKDYSDFFATPQKYFTKISQANHSDYVLACSVGKRNGKYFVRYAIKGKADFWSAELEAETPALLSEKLRTHLARITQAKILEVDTDNLMLINAKLTALHDQHANDLIILQHLILNQLVINAANNAILLTQELQEKSRQQNDPLYEGIAHLYLARAYILQEHIADAEVQLHKADAIFNQQKNYRWLSAAQEVYENIAFFNNSYEQVKAALSRAIFYAKQAQDVLLQIQLNHWLSVMAMKYHQEADQVFYLNQSELLLDQNHLSQEHYAVHYFHVGMHAKDEAIAEHNFRRTLQLLTENQGWWARNEARKWLVDLLIKQQRWQDAIDLFKQAAPITPAQELMLIKVYLAQQNWPEAESRALHAFKQSSLSGQKYIALNAALLLAEFYHQQDRLGEQQFYNQFIEKEYKTVPFWVRFNKDKADKLGIKLDANAQEIIR
jgi:DNA-binding winged helix-turn-helix (wHTH) protein